MITQINIVLTKKFYTAGSAISGYIDLRLLEPLPLHQISLTISKHVRINLREINENIVDSINNSMDDSINARMDDSINSSINDTVNKNNTHKHGDYSHLSSPYSNTFTIYENTDPLNEISSGHHTFPFRLHLKKTDNASTRIRALYDETYVDIENRYDLTVHVKRIGIYAPIITKTREVQIIDRISGPLSLSADAEIFSFLCMFSKRYEVRFALDKLTYLAGEEMRINGVVESGVVKSVDVHLHEILSMNLGRVVVMTRSVASCQAEPRKFVGSEGMNCGGMNYGGINYGDTKYRNINDIRADINCGDINFEGINYGGMNDIRGDINKCEHSRRRGINDPKDIDESKKLDERKNPDICRNLDECNNHYTLNSNESRNQSHLRSLAPSNDKKPEISEYVATLRIPNTMPSTVSESNFNFQAVVFVDISFYKRRNIRLKKFIQVIKQRLEFPSTEILNVLEGERWEEKIFTVT